MATDSNGLYYMRARYYNPDIKRFINQDIKVGDIGSSQSLNRYAYCEGNPVSMVDPFGLCGGNANDQGQKSKYQFWHNVLGAGGYLWDGFDLINGALYAAEGDYVNAAISFACGIPAVGNIIAGVAKASKAVKAIKTAEKIASACRTVGKIGNTAAGMKAMYDTYQTAQRECKTAGGKIAYMAGTLAVGYAMGKAANWAAGKLKNLASKAMPKLKTAVKEAAGKLASRFNKGFGSSGSGHMSRNRGFATLPFGKSGSNTTRVFTSEDPLVGDVATQIEQSLPGRVIAVNRKVYKPDGNPLTDLDIELDTIVIQVKTGAGHKLVEQLFKSVDSTGKIAIGYVPKIRHSILKEATNSGFQVFRNMDDLIEFISQH